MASSLDQLPSFAPRLPATPATAATAAAAAADNNNNKSIPGCEVDFQQQELSLVVTMYQEAQSSTQNRAVFQHKTGSLVVRLKLPQKAPEGGRGRSDSKTKRKAVQFRGLGLVELDLAAALASPAGRQEVQLAKCAAPGAVGVFTVTAHVLEEEEGGESALFGESMLCSALCSVV
jgi:hypothetical protein